MSRSVYSSTTLGMTLLFGCNKNEEGSFVSRQNSMKSICAHYISNSTIAANVAMASSMLALSTATLR